MPHFPRSQGWNCGRLLGQENEVLLLLDVAIVHRGSSRRCEPRTRVLVECVCWLPTATPPGPQARPWGGDSHSFIHSFNNAFLTEYLAVGWFEISKIWFLLQEPQRSVPRIKDTVDDSIAGAKTETQTKGQRVNTGPRASPGGDGR